MKRNGSHLRQYLPWLGLLLGVDALAALLLWLADARAFAAMTACTVLVCDHPGAIMRSGVVLTVAMQRSMASMPLTMSSSPMSAVLILS